MIKIVCDRCGMTIQFDNKPFPVKFDIYKHSTETAETNERTIQYHLCNECTKDLERFFRGEAVK